MQLPATILTLPGHRLLSRLSLLMFLMYAVPGALLPLFSLRLHELHFTAIEISWACATQALACLIAPLAAGQVADRWFPAERCVGLCSVLAGALLWVLAEQTEPWTVFWLALAFWLVMVPVLTLGTTLCFVHMPVPERHYGRVRLWGTVGWVASGWVLCYWFIDPAWLCQVVAFLRPNAPHSVLSDAFRLAGLLAFVLSAYAWTLPHTPPQKNSTARFAPLAALHLLRRRPFAVYLLCTLGLCVTLPFSSQVTPLLLGHLGVPRAWLFPTLTIAQSTEMLTLALLPMILMRLGMRDAMILGLSAWVVALWVLALGQPAWLVIVSLSLNGLCITCYLVVGQVFVNSQASGGLRASVQGLLSFTTGLGMFIGNLAVGWVRHFANGDFPPTFAVAASLATLLLLAFCAGFSLTESMPAPRSLERNRLTLPLPNGYQPARK